MTEKDIKEKLTKKLDEEEKLEIFQWWLKNKTSHVATIVDMNNKISPDLWLKDVTAKINSARDLELLEYSINRIKEYYET